MNHSVSSFRRERKLGNKVIEMYFFNLRRQTSRDVIGPTDEEGAGVYVDSNGNCQNMVMLKSRCDCRDEGVTVSGAPQQVGKEAEGLVIYHVLPEDQELMLCSSGVLTAVSAFWWPHQGCGGAGCAHSWGVATGAAPLTDHLSF